MKYCFLIFITIFCIISNINLSNASKGGLLDSLEISAAGMKVQSKRLAIISQNIANSESTGLTTNEMPYRRRLLSVGLSSHNDQNLEMIKIKKIELDKSPFKVKFEPTHPAANEQGYVLYPNVDKTVEINDAREAQRSFEANLSMIEISKNLAHKTLEILR